MGNYPVNLVLEGRSCLVVGGGRIAARKVEGLASCGGRVHVVAPRIDAAIKERTGVTWEERPYRSGEVADHHLVITATDRPEVNRAVYEDGERLGVWVNSADDPGSCSFILPSVLRRGDLVVAVSSSGRSPALASWLARRLGLEIGPEYETLLDLLASEREALKASGRTTEGLDWQKALDSDMLDLIRTGQFPEARERLHTCLSSSSA